MILQQYVIEFTTKSEEKIEKFQTFDSSLFVV